MGNPHEKNPNSVNITLKKMTMKICLGRRDRVGRGDLWGIEGVGIKGLGHWGIRGLGRSGEIHGVLSPDI